MRTVVLALLGKVDPAPHVTPWREACRPLFVKRFHTSELLEANILNTSDRNLHRVRDRVLHDIHERRSLCDRQQQCSITVNVTSGSLHVCLPEAVIRSARLCEPWGEKWQRIGTRLDRCFDLNVSAIVMWYDELRSTRPFLTKDDALASHLATKTASEQKGVGAEAELALEHRFRELLHVGAQGEDAAMRNRPGLLRSCAVVGSGHDLMCGSRSIGSAIDRQYDGVFRANSAQHYSLGTVGQMMKRALSSRRDWRFLFLLKTRSDPNRAGTRTTFRVNCLFASQVVDKNETCIVSRSWLRQPWDRERFMNMRHPCCDRIQFRSNYTLPRLLELANEGARLRFLRSASRFTIAQEAALQALERSSGGNALIAALALCKRVSLFGAGLYATGPTDDKRYVHYYDDNGVGQCANQSDPRIARYVERHLGRPGVQRLIKQWRRDRIQHELFLHVLHALGMIQWTLPQ